MGKPADIFRWGQNDRDRLPEMAADLVRRKVDVIAAPGSAVGALPAKALTTTIPIVFGMSGDPVLLGLVASELVPKELGLLHELLPGAAPL